MLNENQIHSVFGERLKKKRLECGLSVIDLYAKIYDISDDAKKDLVSRDCNTIYQWQKGICMPKDLKTIVKLCTILNCSVDYLLGIDNCNNKDNQSISEITGLSDNAIDHLKLFKREIEQKDAPTLIVEGLSNNSDNSFWKDLIRDRLNALSLIIGSAFCGSELLDLCRAIIDAAEKRNMLNRQAEIRKKVLSEKDDTKAKRYARKMAMISPEEYIKLESDTERLEYQASKQLQEIIMSYAREEIRKNKG